MTRYTLFKPIRVWQQHRSIRRKLAEIAAIEHCLKSRTTFQTIA